MTKLNQTCITPILTDTVFIVECELGSESTLFKDTNAIGGFVSCAVKACDIHQAIKRCELALKSDGYDILLVESARLFEAEDYVDLPEIENIAAEAVKSGDVVYSIFRTYLDS